MEREAIGRGEAAADRKSLSKLGDAKRKGLEELDEIVRGGFPANVRTQGEDEFRNGAAGSAIVELRDAEIIRPDVVEGSEPASQRVVVSVINAGAFDGEDVERLLHHAELSGIPIRSSAD